MPRTAAILLIARGARAFGDGFTGLLLPLYLIGLGFGAVEVGAITSATLLGSAALTLGVGMAGHRVSARRLLMASSWLMLATGLAFSQARDFWPLMVVGFVGTLNPSGGDVSVFVPLEQALLADAAPDGGRTSLFARYSLTGSLATAVGALSVGLLTPLLKLTGLSATVVIQGAFALYGLIGLAAFLLYARLARERHAQEAAPAPLGPSRARIFTLAGLFSLDAFGGGFLVQSLLALWLFQRFGLSPTAAGGFFFWAGVLTAFSQLASGRLARRVGLINTMVFTHIPANLCVAAAAFAPTLPLVLGLLLARAALSQMDVPARASYVMAIVTPAERAAAASVTNVPRSLASALSPSLAGLLFGASPFAWPLLIGGGLKIAYDLALLSMFRRIQPTEERR